MTKVEVGISNLDMYNNSVIALVTDQGPWQLASWQVAALVEFHDMHDVMT